MDLLFVFTIIIINLANATDKDEIELKKLCLKINSISIDGVGFTKPQMKWAQTEGIFYVYNPSDSMDTFKSLKFPIVAESTSKKTDESNSATPTIFTFTFTGDDSIVGCWIDPNFNSLNIRFKLYEFYHTALKAVSVISTDDIDIKKQIITLNTLPYQYKDANVNVDITLEWLKTQIGLAAPPPISPIGPPGQPGQPPISLYFDSEELTNDIITADEGDELENASDMDNNQATDWMFVAALCSSILGLFILIYICLSAYRRYGYENIPNGNKLKIKKISLRNITNVINSINEERKGIMHPSQSYTFTE
eukprot:83887_1